MIRRPSRDQRGFSIVEVCVAGFLGMIFFTGVFLLYRGGSKMFRKTDATVEATESATLTMGLIGEDLRNLGMTRDWVNAGKLPFRVDGQQLQIDQKRSVILGENQGLNQGVHIHPRDDALDIAVGGGTSGSGGSGTRLDVVWIRYKLHESTSGSRPKWILGRRDPRQREERLHRSVLLKQVAVHIEGQPRAADPSATGSVPTGVNTLFWARVVVAGVSMSLEDPLFRDYYRVTLATLYSLDAINERIDPTNPRRALPFREEDGTVNVIDIP